MKDLNEQITKIRHSWGEYSEHCQDDIMEAIEQALKETIEATCKAMLVEERELDEEENEGFDISSSARVNAFNQCCALQREKAEKLKRS